MQIAIININLMVCMWVSKISSPTVNADRDRLNEFRRVK